MPSSAAGLPMLVFNGEYRQMWSGLSSNITIAPPSSILDERTYSAFVMPVRDSTSCSSSSICNRDLCFVMPPALTTPETPSALQACSKSYLETYFVLPEEFRHRGHNNSGLFYPIIANDGIICGNWKPFVKGLEVYPFHSGDSLCVEGEWKR